MEVWCHCEDASHGCVGGASLRSPWAVTCGGLAGRFLRWCCGRGLTCFRGGQVFDVARVWFGGLVLHVAPLGRCLLWSRGPQVSRHAALVRQVWQKPAVPRAADLVTVLWPFTGDLRGGLGQILQRGVRVTGDQHIGHHRGVAGHLCLLALLVVLGTCIPWLDGSLAASLVGVRGCAGRLGSRRALNRDADALCGSGCSSGCWHCRCCWCCWCCHGRRS